MNEAAIRAAIALLGLLSLVGCKVGDGDDDKKAGTTNQAAAEALTKSLIFEGGELVEGLMPDTTTQDVSLVPGPTSSIEPGASALMSFDVVPGSADTAFALIQLSDAESHFKVLLDGAQTAADGGTDADGGTGTETPRRIELSYEVKKSVCAKLCDRVYELGVLQAVRLADEDVSKRATATFRLDCSDDGDHAQCGEADEKADDEAKDKDASTSTGTEKDAASGGNLMRDGSQAQAMGDSGGGDVIPDASISSSADAGATESLDVTGIWVSDYDCGGGDVYWVVWEITGSGDTYTISDGFITYDATLTDSHMVVTRGNPDAGGTTGYLDFTADGHFTGEFDEGTKLCTEIGRRAPGLDVTASGPVCNTGGATNLPSCTPICDASSTCGQPACTCTTALSACPDELTVWQNCLDAEQIDTPVFMCPAFEPSSCWAEWDLCVVGADCF